MSDDLERELSEQTEAIFRDAKSSLEKNEFVLPLCLIIGEKRIVIAIDPRIMNSPAEKTALCNSCEILARGLLKVRELRRRRPRPSFRHAAEELQTLIPESSLAENSNFLFRYALPAILSKREQDE